MPEKKPNKILSTLKEIDGLVLAFIGFMILYAFSAYGITIPFIGAVAIVTLIIIAVIVYYVYFKKGKD